MWLVTNTPTQIIYDQQLCIQQIPQDRFHVFHVSCLAIYNLSQWSASLPTTSDLIHLFQSLLLSALAAGSELQRDSIYQEKFQLKCWMYNQIGKKCWFFGVCRDQIWSIKPEDFHWKSPLWYAGCFTIWDWNGCNKQIHVTTSPRV